MAALKASFETARRKRGEAGANTDLAAHQGRREKMTAKTTSRDRLDAALVDVHSEIHELLEAVKARVDAVDPDTADWGHVVELQDIASRLREAAGIE
jgi:hypothetical protein